MMGITFWALSNLIPFHHPMDHGSRHRPNFAAALVSFDRLRVRDIPYASPSRASVLISSPYLRISPGTACYCLPVRSLHALRRPPNFGAYALEQCRRLSTVKSSWSVPGSVFSSVVQFLLVSAEISLPHHIRRFVWVVILASNACWGRESHILLYDVRLSSTLHFYTFSLAAASLIALFPLSLNVYR